MVCLQWQAIAFFIKHSHRLQRYHIKAVSHSHHYAPAILDKPHCPAPAHTQRHLHHPQLDGDNTLRGTRSLAIRKHTPSGRLSARHRLYALPAPRLHCVHAHFRNRIFNGRQEDALLLATHNLFPARNPLP